MSSKNILLITSDQQHWFTLGIQNPEIKTPNLDRLAKKGVIFNRAYCPNPTCTPTRASIITGMYPSQHGAWTLGTKLDEKVPTLGDNLLAQGYHTALIGKAHFQPLKSTEEYPSLESHPIVRDLDFWKKYDKRFYGFDQAELARNHTDEAHVGQHYALWMEEKGFKDWSKHFENWFGNIHYSEPQQKAQKHRWSIPQEYHYNTWIAERSINSIRKSKKSNKPFFLWSSFFDPHPSYLVPEPWASMYDPNKITVPEGRAGEHENNPPPLKMTQEENPDYSEFRESGHQIHGCYQHKFTKEDLAKDIAIYYGMISFMDHSIGQILDALESEGLEKETLVVFTSDHGHYYGHHDLMTKGPFHYDDGIKVPFIASQPGKLPQGKENNSLLSLIDLAPTFLDFLNEKSSPIMSGVSLKEDFLNPDKSTRDHLLVEMRHEYNNLHLKTYIDERYKLTVYKGHDYGELRDLEKDPGEFENFWDHPDYQQVKAKLMTDFVQAEMKKEALVMPRLATA